MFQHRTYVPVKYSKFIVTSIGNTVFSNFFFLGKITSLYVQDTSQNLVLMWFLGILLEAYTVNYTVTISSLQL